MNPRIDIQQIKTTSCVSYLAQHGFKPDPKSNQSKVFFKSPIRPQENTASFCIYPKTNTWYDWGSSTSGSIIELCMLLEKCTFKEAIIRLSKGSYGRYFDFGVSNIQKENPIVIHDVIDLVDTNLVSYLRDVRKIDIELCKPYVKQLLYENTNKGLGKIRSAIGFQNDKGGWEMRTEQLKIASQPKCITTINPDTDICFLFEGWVDMLSFITYIGKLPTNTVVVLNSASFIKRVKEYKTFYYYGDNDATGDKVLAQLIEMYPNSEIIDKRDIYKEYKDFNDYLKTIR